MTNPIRERIGSTAANRMFPPRLYKYTEHEYARQFLEDGRTQLGTLSYYRDRESVDELRGDKDEALLHVTEHHPDAITPDKLSPMAQQYFRADAEGVQLQNVIFDYKDGIRDGYVFCVSLDLSHSAAGSYPACVEIFDVPAFVNSINNAVRDQPFCLDDSVEMQVGHIAYRDREVTHIEARNVHPAFFKPERFSIEKEWRAFWGTSTSATNGRPGIAQLANVKSFARLVTIPDSL